MKNTTRKRVFSTEGVDNPLKGITRKYRPYGRLGEKVTGVCSPDHARKIVKYGLFTDSLTAEIVLIAARELAKEIKKEVEQSLTSEIYQ